jgi:hypothetical protein
MKIEIKNKEYELKYTIRAMFMFEQITEKPFAIQSLFDNYMFYYCMLLANNDDCLSWEEFMDALDTDLALPEKLAYCLQKNKEVEDLLNLNKEENAGEDSSKKD